VRETDVQFLVDIAPMWLLLTLCAWLKGCRQFKNCLKNLKKALRVIQKFKRSAGLRD
jgi:hypothetical protein